MTMLSKIIGHFSKVTAAARSLSTKTKSYSEADEAIKTMIDDYLQRYYHILPPPIFHDSAPATFISKMDAYGILKQTPTHELPLILRFLKEKNIKIDFLSFEHRLKNPIHVLYPALPDPDTVLAFADASGIGVDDKQKEKNFAIGSCSVYLDEKGIARTCVNRSKVYDCDIVLAESMAMDMCLNDLLKLGFKDKKKVMWITDNDVVFERLRMHKVYDKEAEFDFYCSMFDKVQKFSHLSRLWQYREGNLAHIVASEEEEEKIDVTPLLDLYKKGSPIFVLRFVERWFMDEGRPPSCSAKMKQDFLERYFSAAGGGVGGGGGGQISLKDTSQ